MRTVLTITAVGVALLIAACASDTPRVDAAYGKAVARMVADQTLDPGAATAMPPAPPGDGQRLKNALDANRKDVAKGTPEVARPMTFDVPR